MKTYGSRNPPVRRDMTDSRSTAAPAAATRKVLLNDSRSTASHSRQG